MPHSLTVEPLRLSLTTAPAKQPVTMDEIRAYLRLETDDIDEDPVIAALVVASTDHAEIYLGRALITQTFLWSMDRWPVKAGHRGDQWWDGVRTGSMDSLYNAERSIDVPRPPLQSVTSITTYDDADVSSVFAASKYYVDTAGQPGRIVLRNSAETPAPTRVANGIETVYIAGYGDDYADVPESIRQGILRMATHLYEHRGECTIEQARDISGAAALWSKYRILRL